MKCPSGMVNGFIKWDDENDDNRNQALGTLPRGNYTQDTLIFYCCQNQSTWYDVIQLPITSPFYLLPYKPSSQDSTECQRVRWALATLEYIQFDTEENNNEDDFHSYHVATDKQIGQPKIYYCYYQGRFSTLHFCGNIENVFNQLFL
jgi:hypothetical protein